MLSTLCRGSRRRRGSLSHRRRDEGRYCLQFALGTSYESGFVGLTGVPSYSQFERALEDLNSIGVVRINIMVDSDYQVKEEVRKARDRYVEMGVAAGFEVAPITWTQKRKGVDDLYKHLSGTNDYDLGCSILAAALCV